MAMPPSYPQFCELIVMVHSYNRAKNQEDKKKVAKKDPDAEAVRHLYVLWLLLSMGLLAVTVSTT